MNNIFPGIKKLIKDEIVLVIATILAILSCFFVPISTNYIDYIDLRVIALLFCLMLIVSGFRYVNFFNILANTLFKFASSLHTIALIFIMLCFFSSMLITNDVALILFVPFSIFVSKDFLNQKQFIIFIVLETIAANLGSMFTPIGNPQNLYLYSTYNMDLGHFFITMFPYTACAFIMLIASSFIFKNTPSINTVPKADNLTVKCVKLHYISYIVLFILTLATVVKAIPYQITFIVCIFVITIINPGLFAKVDYFLLLTFIAFFILVGNLGSIDTIREFITGMTDGNEVMTSIIASQFISNVPCALLLSCFTGNSTGLLVGTNLGGLGTIIASMASLISYKFYAKENNSNLPLYFVYFTIFNVIFLMILLGLWYMIG